MPSKVMTLFAPVFVLLLLFAAACGDGDVTETTSTATDTPAAGTTTATPAAGTTAAQTPAAQSTATAPAPATPAAPVEKLNVVATSNIVADWILAVGQDRVEVLSLLPVNADPHTYQPGARDITRIADADRVFSIGLSLEAGWLNDLIENAAQSPDVLMALGDAVDPIQFVELMPHGAEAETELIGRLLVGDGESGALSIVDLEHGDVEQDAFDMGARAGRIYATRSGRFAIAVSGDANTAHIFDGGIYLEAHGGHFDLIDVEPSQLGIDLSGDAPSHLYVGSEWSGIFYDGTGDVVLINEHELEEENDSYVPTRFNAGAQHGGLVVLEDDLFAVTTQHPDYVSDPGEYRLPVGADIRNLSGNVLYTAPGCDGLHGDAGNGHMAVFGCMGGVLAVEAHAGEYEHAFIPAPAGSPEDFRITSVWGYPGADHFYGLGSAVGLYEIDPEGGEMEQLIPASEELRPIQVAIRQDGEALLVAMSDGELRMYDAHDGDLVATNSEALTTPVETGSWGRPHFATAPGAIFVTDSVGGAVLQLDDHDLEEVAHWEVAGKPVKIAFVGVLGQTEDHAEQGHAEAEDDGHGHGELDPHFWFDPLRVKQAVNSIAAQLSSVDPAGQTFYRDNAAAYARELDDLHAWITEQVAHLPQQNRLLVTSHDSFQYFAQRYGFEVVGAIFPMTTETEPTAQDLAGLIETIEHEGATAVFTEHTQSDRLARRIAEETGASLIGGLYTGSLGEAGSEASNYLDLMRHNTNTIVEALK